MKTHPAVEPNTVSEPNTRTYRVVHLDDHLLYRQGLKNYLAKELSAVEVEGFPTGTEALDHIENCFKNNIRIDLVITDFVHPEPDGILFAKEIKSLDKKFSLQTPIMMLTMCSDYSPVVEAAKEGTFDVLFSKATPPEKFVRFIREKIKMPNISNL